MARREEHADILYQFLKTVHESLIEPLKRNQVKISWQRELGNSKRFTDAEAKIAEFYDAYLKVRDSFVIRDQVLNVLHTVHATRMQQYLETGGQISVDECDALKDTLSPYLNLLAPVDEIKRLQIALVNHGKLKKMPLPYDEITAALNSVTALSLNMPKILMEGISNLSASLEKVA